MSTEIVYLENFFARFDTNLVGIELDLNKKTNKTYQQIELYFDNKQVESKLNESRENLLLKLNKQFRGQFENVNKVLSSELKQFLLGLIDSLEYNQFKDILFKLKCKLHDCSDLNEIIIDSQNYNLNQQKLSEFFRLIKNLVSYSKVLFKTSDAKFDVTHISDIYVRNDFINLAKCDYFHLYNSFGDPRLAGQILAHDDLLNYRVVPLTTHRIFVYPKSFAQAQESKIKIVYSNGTEISREMKGTIPVAYHFILTSKYLVAVFFDLARLKYNCELYDLKLNLICGKNFRKEVNLIEIDENEIKLKTLYNKKLIDEFCISNTEFSVENQHLKKRILFSYNDACQCYKIKIKSNDYLFKSIDSSFLQAANKSLVLAYSHMIEKNILLEFASSDKMHYDFMQLD